MTLSKLMPTPKLMLTVVTGGILLGAVGGQLTNPVMKVAEQPDWRSHYASRFSSTPGQFVEAGPEDLSPATWFGPVYAEPAVFTPQYTAIPEYSPTMGNESYSTRDEPEPYVAPEVAQASARAASTAADLAEASAAAPQDSEVLGSGTMPDPVLSDAASSDLVLADKTS